jgi:hypothetical protein
MKTRMVIRYKKSLSLSTSNVDNTDGDDRSFCGLVSCVISFPDKSHFYSRSLRPRARAVRVLTVLRLSIVSARQTI